MRYYLLQSLIKIFLHSMHFFHSVNFHVSLFLSQLFKRVIVAGYQFSGLIFPLSDGFSIFHLFTGWDSNSVYTAGSRILWLSVKSVCSFS